jgi:hypothetical protein
MKKLIATTLAIFLIAASASSSIAASAKCTVTAVDKSVVTLDCGDKADKFTVGAKVKVKTAKKKAIEGC